MVRSIEGLLKLPEPVLLGKYHRIGYAEPTDIQFVWTNEAIELSYDPASITVCSRRFHYRENPVVAWSQKVRELKEKLIPDYRSIMFGVSCQVWETTFEAVASYSDLIYSLSMLYQHGTTRRSENNELLFGGAEARTQLLTKIQELIDRSHVAVMDAVGTYDEDTARLMAAVCCAARISSLEHSIDNYKEIIERNTREIEGLRKGEFPHYEEGGGNA